MSEFDRGFRDTRELQNIACDEVPGQRGQPRTRVLDGGACDEIPGQELPGEAQELPGGAQARPGNVIARVATNQQGTITKQQLLDAGLGSNAVDRRAEGGTLHRVHRGIYLVGHEALPPRARETAALLACGDRAIISHCSGAGLWELAPPAGADAEVHVTVIGRRRRSRPGLRVHYATRLDPRDLRCVHGLPVTAPARTLLDLAAARYPDLERAFAEAHAQRLLTARDLEHAIKRAGPRPGVRALRALMSDNASGYTRSRAERLLRRAIRSSRLPPPDFNLPFGKYELDAVWPEQRLVVEVDGYNFHGHRAQFESDRRKDMALTAAGYRVIRLTYRQLTNEPLAVVAAIAIALSPGRNPG
jgi:very-short-patch-repair endonuclease